MDLRDAQFSGNPAPGGNAGNGSSYPSIRMRKQATDICKKRSGSKLTTQNPNDIENASQRERAKANGNERLKDRFNKSHTPNIAGLIRFSKNEIP